MSIQKELDPLRATRGRDEARIEAEPHPYRGYRLKPGQRAGGIRINRHGFRGPEIVDSKPSIVVLGNSTLFGSGLTEAHTITHRLSERWPGHNVVNAGITGYTVPQELLLLIELFGSFRIDQVVLLDGYTECFFAFHNRELNCLPYYYDRRFDQLRTRSLWNRFQARAGWLRPENCDWPRPEPADVAKNHGRYARHIGDLCAARGARCHVVIQPTVACQVREGAELADPGLRERVGEVERRYAGLTAYIRRCYAAFQAEADRTERDDSLHFAGDLLVGEPALHYQDMAHYTEGASRIIAGYIDGLLRSRNAVAARRDGRQITSRAGEGPTA